MTGQCCAITLVRRPQLALAHHLFISPSPISKDRLHYVAGLIHTGSIQQAEINEQVSYRQDKQFLK